MQGNVLQKHLNEENCEGDYFFLNAWLQTKSCDIHKNRYEHVLLAAVNVWAEHSEMAKQSSSKRLSWQSTSSRPWRPQQKTFRNIDYNRWPCHGGGQMSLEQGHKIIPSDTELCLVTKLIERMPAILPLRGSWWKYPSHKSIPSKWVKGASS